MNKSSDPMKILFISPRFEGGIGGHAARVAKKMREHGYEITLMKPSFLPINKMKNPSFALTSTIKSMIGRERYDIVHAFNIPSAFAMRYAKAKKKVLSAHGIYSEQVSVLHSDPTAGAAKLTESKVMKWADKLTTDSKTVQKQYKEKLGIDFEYLPAPTDIERFKDIPDVSKKEKQIIYIGRDSYEKGIDFLRKIENHIDAKIVYCTNVEWKEAMLKLKESNILIIPSRMESIPHVIHEAFYLKVPIIATNVGGIPELITHEENGLLIPPDNEQKLIESINRLLHDKEFAINLAENGHTFLLENLTWEVLLPKYIKFYEDLLNS